MGFGELLGYGLAIVVVIAILVVPRVDLLARVCVGRVVPSVTRVDVVVGRRLPRLQDVLQDEDDDARNEAHHPSTRRTEEAEEIRRRCDAVDDNLKERRQYECGEDGCRRAHR